MYDEVYFDSDSEEEDKPSKHQIVLVLLKAFSWPTALSPRRHCSASLSSAGSSTGRRRKQRAIPTNDELLYDPDEDDRDQAWVDARRRR